MEFSRQEYWSGLPFPSPGDLPDPGIEPGSPALQADSLPAKAPGKQEKFHSVKTALGKQPSPFLDVFLGLPLAIYTTKVKSLSRVRLLATSWTVAHQAPPSMEFSRQEYWSGLPFPSPGDLPDPGIEHRSPALQADALLFEPPEKSVYKSQPIVD